MLVAVEKDSRLHTGFLVSCAVAVMGRLNGIALFFCAFATPRLLSTLLHISPIYRH